MSGWVYTFEESFNLSKIVLKPSQIRKKRILSFLRKKIFFKSHACVKLIWQKAGNFSRRLFSLLFARVAPLFPQELRLKQSGKKELHFCAMMYGLILSRSTDVVRLDNLQFAIDRNPIKSVQGLQQQNKNKINYKTFQGQKHNVRTKFCILSILVIQGLCIL